MYRSLLISPALAIMAFASIACSNEPQNTPPPDQSKTEEIKQDIKNEADEVAKKAEETAKKLESQVKDKPATTATVPAAAATTPAPANASSSPASASTAAVTTDAPTAEPAPAASASAPTPASEEVVPEEPLKTQFNEKKTQSLKTIELDLAKDKALNRTSDLLSSETDSLYKDATDQLSWVLGELSSPEVQENYYFNSEDPSGGRFEVSLVRDSYVKSGKGDVCLVSTKVSVHTTIDSELTPPTAVSDTAVPTEETESAEQTALQTPEKYTEIKCFNDGTPTLYQQIVR